MKKEIIIEKLEKLKNHVENEPQLPVTYKAKIEQLRKNIHGFYERFPWTWRTLEMCHAPNKGTLRLIRNQIIKGSENQEFNKALPILLDNCVSLIKLEGSAAEEYRTFRKNFFDWRKKREELHQKLPSEVEVLFERFELECEMPEYSDDIIVANLIIELIKIFEG